MEGGWVGKKRHAWLGWNEGRRGFKEKLKSWATAMTSFLQSPCQQYSEVTLSPKSLLPNLGVSREARVISTSQDPCPTQPHSRHCSYPASPRETPEPRRNMLILSWWGLWSSRILPLGPAPATGRGSGRRRNPGFCSGRDKEEETAAFRRS